MTAPPAPILEKDITTPPTSNTPTTSKNPHTNSKTHPAAKVAFSTQLHRDGQTKSTLASQKNNNTDDIQMADNPYHGEDTRERLLNNAVNIKFERDRYTTPITIEFRQQKDNGSINPAKLHRALFAEMLLIDSTTKVISNNGMTFTNPKELPQGNEYSSTFTEATIHNQKFNSVKAYICCNIETSIPYKKFLYSTNGDKTILPLLKTNNMWLKWNKFSTHREASIGFIKFVNPNLTLQTAVRSRIELALCSMPLTSEETKNFSRPDEGKNAKQRMKQTPKISQPTKSKMIVNSNLSSYQLLIYP